MASIMVIRRDKSAKLVESAADSHGPMAIDAIVARQSPPVTVGESSEDLRQPLGLFVGNLRRELTTAREDLVAADQRHLAELDNDRELRSRRDEVVNDLRSDFGQLRDTFRGLFGPDDAAKLALEGPTEREPATVLRVAQDVVLRLRDPAIALSQPRFQGFTVDTEALVAQLEPKTAELSAIFDELNRQARAAEVTQRQKNLAMEAFDATFLRIARLLEAIFELAGLSDLAARVRPSTHRPGRREADEADDNETPQPDTPPADPAAPAPSQPPLTGTSES